MINVKKTIYVLTKIFDHDLFCKEHGLKLCKFLPFFIINATISVKHYSNIKHTAKNGCLIRLKSLVSLVIG